MIRRVCGRREWAATLVFLAISPAIPAAPGSAQTLVPPGAIASAPVEVHASAAPTAPTTLEAIHARLEGLAGADFDRVFAELVAVRPDLTLDALILRAGTPTPPGLTAARTARRESLRQESLQRVRSELASDERGELARERLLRLLTGASDEDLWCAAAYAAAWLGRYELAEHIAAALSDDAPSRVRQVAGAALFELYARRFDSREAFASFWERAQGLDADALFLDALRAEQARNRELESELLQLQPEGAVELLSDPDPWLRIAAAGGVGMAVARQRLSVQEAIGILTDHLATEIDPAAFHAASEALLLLLGAARPDSASVGRLRTVLHEVGSAGNRSLEWQVLSTLARLPWDDTIAEGAGSLNEGVTAVAGLFARFARQDRPLDSGLLVRGLETLGSLCLRAGDPKRLRASFPPSAITAVHFLLEDYTGPEEVRIAAAGAVSVTVFGQDAVGLVGILESERTSAPLAYQLLGSLARIAADLDPGGEPARRVCESLIRFAGHAEDDLSRRALEILAQPEMEPLVQAGGGDEVADRLVGLLVRLGDRVEEPGTRQLQSLVLLLLRRYERPDLVDEILRSDLAWLDRGDPSQLAEFATTLQRLSGGDPERIMSTAETLLFPLGPRFVPLEIALGLVGSLSEESARSLSHERQLTIVKWALELRAASGTGEAAVVPLERLRRVHLEGAGQMPGIDGRALAHAWALFLGDAYLAGDRTIEPEQVLARYKTALQFDREVPGGSAGHATAARMQLNRARFLDALGRSEDALEDFRAVLAREADSPEPSVFELSDLRRVAFLLATPSTNGPDRRRERAESAFDLTLRLVRSDSWQFEAAGVRLQDLQDLAQRALASPDAGDRAIVHEALEGLPPLPPEGTQEPGTNGVPGGAPRPVWSGLLRERAWHETLLQLSSSVRSGRRDGRPEEASADVLAIEPIPVSD